MLWRRCRNLRRIERCGTKTITAIRTTNEPPRTDQYWFSLSRISVTAMPPEVRRRLCPAVQNCSRTLGLSPRGRSPCVYKNLTPAGHSRRLTSGGVAVASTQIGFVVSSKLDECQTIEILDLVYRRRLVLFCTCSPPQLAPLLKRIPTVQNFRGVLL
jgi:hypothetical protein